MAGKLSAATTTGGARQITALCRHLEFFARHPPLAIMPLKNGELNHNYRVETRRGLYAVRCYPATSNGVCRQQELRCQHAAAVAGIAPAPLYLNNHQQVLISEFINGGSPYIFTEPRIPLLASTLATLHQLPVQTAVLQPLIYLQQLGQNARPFFVTADSELFKVLLNVAEQYQSLASDTVLCHLDLHPGNMLQANSKIWLLDFEYAQLADSYLDLAALSLNFQLSEQAEQRLLAAYWQQRYNLAAPAAADELSAKLQLAKIIFSGFCWIWYLSLQESQAACQAQTSQWQQRLLQLLSLQTT